MDEREADARVEEPEVLPPEGAAPKPGSTGRRAATAFGPIVAGLILDGIDFVGRGPIGIMLGMFVGGTFIYWVTTQYRLPVWQRLLWAAVSGFYCALPWLDRIPLATIVALLIQFWNSRNKD